MANSAQRPTNLKKSLFGYRPGDVAETFANLHSQLAELRSKSEEASKERLSLVQRLDAAEAQVVQLKSELSQALARPDPEIERTQALIDAKRAQIRDVERQYEARRSQLAWEIHSLSLDKERFEADFREILREHLAVLDTIPMPEPSGRAQDHDSREGP